MLADVLPRHTLTASLVWRWLVEVLAGLSLKAAAEKLRLPFALESVYRLQRGLRRNLTALRTRLGDRVKAPPSTQAIVDTGESGRVIQLALKLRF